VAASNTLTDGSTFNFNATYQRQRPALLFAKLASIYAGFLAACCDYAGNLSRGWLLGWTAGSLAPFPVEPTQRPPGHDADTFFLSSIWMSGYGPAADDSGNVFVRDRKLGSILVTTASPTFRRGGQDVSHAHHTVLSLFTSR